VSRRFTRDIPLGLLLCLFAFAIASQNASANPIAPGPDYSSSSDALSDLFLSNLPIDLFWFTVVLYFVFRGLGARAGKIDCSTTIFTARVLIAAIFIAVAGAFIDFYAFYDGNSQDGYAFWSSANVHDGTTYYWSKSAPFLGSPEFFLALIGIFVSIFLVSLLVVRMSWKTSLVPAAVMTALNPIAWVVILDYDFISRRLLIVTAAIMAIVSLALLIVWHSRSSIGADNKEKTTEVG